MMPVRADTGSTRGKDSCPPQRLCSPLGAPLAPMNDTLRATLEKTYRWYVENGLLPDFRKKGRNPSANGGIRV